MTKKTGKTEEREMLKLSWTQMLRLKTLERALLEREEGSEDYWDILDKINLIKYGPEEEEPQPKPQSDKEREKNKLLGEAQYMQYCISAELAFLAKENKDSHFVDYPTFLVNHPGKTIYDLHPNDVTVGHINHEAYRKMLEEDAEYSPRDIAKKCMCGLPESTISIEIAIVKWMLWAEAQRDGRVSNLGYDIESINSCEESGLFDDFFTGALWRVFSRGMKLKEAREEAKRAMEAAKQKNSAEENSTKSSPSKGGSSEGNSNSQPKQQQTKSSTSVQSTASLSKKRKQFAQDIL